MPYFCAAGCGDGVPVPVGGDGLVPALPAVGSRLRLRLGTRRIGTRSIQRRKSSFVDGKMNRRIVRL